MAINSQAMRGLSRPLMQPLVDGRHNLTTLCFMHYGVHNRFFLGSELHRSPSSIRTVETELCNAINDVGCVVQALAARAQVPPGDVLPLPW